MLRKMVNCRTANKDNWTWFGEEGFCRKFGDTKVNFPPTQFYVLTTCN